MANASSLLAMDSSRDVGKRTASEASVVRAAIEIIDSRPDGAGEITLAAVAKRIGIATPSIYKHVNSLADLKRKVAVECVRALKEHTTDAVLGRSGDEALTAIIQSTRTFALTHPGRYAATQLAANRDDIDDTELVLESDQLIRIIGASLVSYGLPDDSLIDAIRVVRAAVHGFILLELGGGFGLPNSVTQSFEALTAILVIGVKSISDQTNTRSKAGSES